MSTVVMMNCFGIAIATDSVHNISQSKFHWKTDNTANKIYRLCTNKESPIAIVLCDNRDYKEVPIELFVVDFRTKNPGPWATIADCKNAFVKYLGTNPICPETSYDPFVDETVSATIYDALTDQFDPETTSTFIDWLKTENAKEIIPWPGMAEPFVVEQKLLDYIKNEVSHKLSFHCRGSENDVSEEEKQEITDLLVALCIKTLFKQCEFDQNSHLGFSFITCGFGTEEHLPCLDYSRIVGKLNQTELVVQGENYRITPYNRAETLCIGEESDVVDSVFFNKNGDTRYKWYETRNVLAGFSLKELARVSKMAIETAALRQHLKREGENIGGPTDVAVISKSDGLQWYSRKLYFSPKLNPQMFNASK